VRAKLATPDVEGSCINDKEFLALGVFHKGFATAKDSNGWFHIDFNGNEIYTDRYLNIEPFYNGFALVEGFDQSKRIIDESGVCILTI